MNIDDLPWLPEELEPRDILAELAARVLTRDPYTEADAAQLERLVLRMRRGEGELPATD